MKSLNINTNNSTEDSQSDSSDLAATVSTGTNESSLLLLKNKSTKKQKVHQNRPYLSSEGKYLSIDYASRQSPQSASTTAVTTMASSNNATTSPGGGEKRSQSRRPSIFDMVENDENSETSVLFKQLPLTVNSS